MLTIHFFHSSLSFILRLEQNGSETIFAAIRIQSKNYRLVDIPEISEETGNFLVPDLVWKPSDFDGNSLFVID